jgi:hypothetical protein
MIYGGIETTFLIMLDDLNKKQEEEVFELLHLNEDEKLKDEIEIIERDVEILIKANLVDDEFEDLYRDSEFDKIVLIPKGDEQ